MNLLCVGPAMEGRLLFNILNREHFLRRKKFWRACMWGVVAVAIIAVVARNLIAKVAITYIGSFVLGNSVAVRQVQIGFETIEISDLKVMETSLADVPQLEIPTIRLAPTIWRGLREGVWLRYVVVREPTLHLRFDHEGNLLSRFPASSGGDTENRVQLPFDRAAVANATLVIHQEGKSDFTIRGASLNASVNQSIHLRAEITDLLGAQLRIESRVDQSTLRGRTRVLLSPLQLESTQLAQLPFVPDNLADHPLKCSVSAKLQMEHPANDLDLLNHWVTFRARVADVDSRQFGYITNGLDLRIFHRDGRSSLAVECPIATGKLRLDAHLNPAEEVPQITATFKLAGVELEQFAKAIVPDLPVSAVASAEGTAHVLWKDRALAFHAALTSILTGIHADGISVGDVRTTIACDGTYDPNRKQPLTGSVSLKTASDGVELAAVARRFGRAGAEGRVGLNASGRIPLATLADLQTYNADVTVHSSPLVCEGIMVRPFCLNAGLKDGNIEVALAEVTLAVANVVERSAECFVDQLPLANTLRVQTRLLTAVPVSRVRELDAWTASVGLDVCGLEIGGEPISDFTTSWQLVRGEINLSPFDIRWRDTICHLAGSGDLREEESAAVRFTAGPVDLRDVSYLASRFSNRPLPVSGTAFATGGINVNLRKLTWAAGGDLTLSDAQYANTRIGDSRLFWKANRQAARLQSVSDDFFGGSYVVDATLQSLDWTTTTVAASGQNIQIRRLTGILGNELPVSGFVEGSLRVSAIGELATLRADGWLRTREASLAGTTLELQTTQLSVIDGVASVAFRGAVLESSLDGDASTRLADLSGWLQDQPQQIHELPVLGRIQVKSVAVKRAIAVFDKRHTLAPLSGKVNINCVRDETAAGRGLLATVDCAAENLRWHQAVMSKRLKATVALYPTRLELNNVEGRLADGKLSGNARLYLARIPSGEFRLDVDRVNLRHALAPIPGVSDLASGAVSFSISGRLGSTSTATARVTASNIIVGGLAIRELRLPMACSFQSQSSQLRWHSRGGSFDVGGGSVAINSEGSLTNGLATMATNVDIRRVDTAKLMPGKSISAGIIDGTVHIQSKRANAANDLNGRFHLELSRIQMLELPGSDSFMRLVNLPTLSGPSRTQEDGGTIDGRLAGGLLHVDNLALSKNGVLVLMNGTSTLEGRLDFDVTALTNQSGPADGLFSLADSPLMLAAPAPVTLLIKANEAIKDRVIHIHVGGTGARPALRLQPGKTLSQDALRFFVSGTLGNRTADIALRQQRQSVRY